MCLLIFFHRFGTNFVLLFQHSHELYSVYACCTPIIDINYFFTAKSINSHLKSLFLYVSTSYGNNQNAPLLMNGLRKCGINGILLSNEEE
jgi:hypothetical protein